MPATSNFDFERARAEVKDYTEEFILWNAQVRYCNFEGRGDMYNAEGKRNFKVLISDPEAAQKLTEEGWNVSMKPSAIEGEPPLYLLKVNVSFKPPYDKLMPKVFRVSELDHSTVMLDENSAAILDNEDIVSADMKIRARPYIDQRTGEHKITAWLLEFYATVRESELAAKYARYEYPEE